MSLVLMTSSTSARFVHKYGSIFKLSLKNFAFLTYFMKKYAIVDISTKKKIICDIGSINMRI